MGLLTISCSRLLSAGQQNRRTGYRHLVTSSGIVVTKYIIPVKIFVLLTIRNENHFDVAAIAAKFNLTPKYFSDLIRQHTGRSAQQHIHDKLIEIAKEKLSGTALSVSEIAYLLGFEHSQSFSRLFKLKTNLTPSEYRSTLN